MVERGLTLEPPANPARFSRTFPALVNTTLVDPLRHDDEYTGRFV
jgi:hypothetical protein